MILLLDIGSSRIKWALYERGLLTRVDALTHDTHDCADRVEEILARTPGPSGILASNVLGPRASIPIETRLRNRTDVPIEYIMSTAEGYGIRSGYSDPGRLGPDRFAALIGAYHEFKSDCIIIDCGTAVTIDALLKDGTHLGGLIAPGLALMRKTLADKIKIPEAHPVVSPALFGRHTEEAVQGGCLRILAAGIEGTVAEMNKYIGADTARVLCGGDAQVLMPLLRASYIHEPHLVLKGLAVMSES